MKGPPVGAPAGTVWFGGPVDRWRITLRVSGEGLDPERVSELLGCQPTEVRLNRMAKRMDATPISMGSQWSVSVNSAEDEDIEDGINALMDRLTDDLEAWAMLTGSFNVDLFCGLFMAAENRGFGLSPATSKRLADRNLEIGFDVYCSTPQTNPG